MEPELAAWVSALLIWPLTWLSTSPPEELSADEPPAAVALAAALLVASELAMNDIAPPAWIDCAVVAVALSVATFKPIAIPTPFWFLPRHLERMSFAYLAVGP